MVTLEKNYLDHEELRIAAEFTGKVRDMMEKVINYRAVGWSIVLYLGVSSIYGFTLGDPSGNIKSVKMDIPAKDLNQEAWIDTLEFMARKFTELCTA